MITRAATATGAERVVAAESEEEEDIENSSDEDDDEFASRRFGKKADGEEEDVEWKISADTVEKNKSIKHKKAIEETKHR